MKLERISENQIRCTITLSDLAARQLKVSELIFQTDKAKALFRDMMIQASDELGFEADNIPLIIEAMPISQDTLTLIITKVDVADEISSRFSKFLSSGDQDTDDDEDMDDDDELYESIYGMDPAAVHAATDDILDIFKRIGTELISRASSSSNLGKTPIQSALELKRATKNLATDSASDSALDSASDLASDSALDSASDSVDTANVDAASSDALPAADADIASDIPGDIADDVTHDIAGDDIDSPAAMASCTENANVSLESEEDIFRIYEFDCLDDISDMAYMLPKDIGCASRLYKSPINKHYYLALSNDNHNMAAFNRVSHIASEFAQTVDVNDNILYYYEEHYEVLIPNSALQILRSI